MVEITPLESKNNTNRADIPYLYGNILFDVTSEYQSVLLDLKNIRKIIFDFFNTHESSEIIMEIKATLNDVPLAHETEEELEEWVPLTFGDNTTEKTILPRAHTIQTLDDFYTFVLLRFKSEGADQIRIQLKGEI